jgi:hypothetical protein
MCSHGKKTAKCSLVILSTLVIHTAPKVVLYSKELEKEKQIHNNRKAITNRNNNADKLIAITIRSDNGTNMPTAINNRSNNESQGC